ncbi:MAG: hypothetical protein AB7Q97_01820 [Gammaproteobacteria bacterium]
MDTFQTTYALPRRTDITPYQPMEARPIQPNGCCAILVRAGASQHNRLAALKGTFRRVLFFLTLCFTASYGAFCPAEDGKPDSISVLGVNLQLGASKAATFAHFSSYKVVCIGTSILAPDCDSWVVESNGPPYTPYANLSFEGGHLKQIWKYWDRGYEGTDPWRFVETLHAALSSYLDKSGGEVAVQTKETKDGNVVQKAIFISKGNRTIVINSGVGVRDPDGKEAPPFVNLSEILK